MVEILLATYNGEVYLKEQLESLENQTCKKWKLIVCDDGSSDGTIQILNEFKKNCSNPVEIHFNDGKIHGPAANFNKLMYISKAEHVAFCDQDDVWLPTKLEHSLNLLTKLEKVFGCLPILVHTDLFIADKNLNIIRNSMCQTQRFNCSSNKTIKQLVVQNCVTGCTMMANRRLIKLCGLIPKEAVMHDWWLAMLACAFGKLEFLNESTIYYRQHDSNTIGVTPIDLVPEEMLEKKSILIHKPVTKHSRFVVFLNHFGFNRFKLCKLYKLFSPFFWFHFTRNIFNMFKRRKKVKENLYDTFFQSKVFLKNYRRILNREQKHILKNYCSLFQGNKFNRVKNLIVSGYLKRGFMRKLSQMFYI